MKDGTSNIAIRSDLHLRCKKRAVNEGKTLQELIEEMIAFAFANMSGMLSKRKP